MSASAVTKKELSLDDALADAITEFRDSKKLEREKILKHRFVSLMRVHVAGAIGKNLTVQDVIADDQKLLTEEKTMTLLEFMKSVVQAVNETKQEIRDKFQV